MKYLILMTAFLSFLTVSSNAQIAEQNVETTIEEVKIHLRGAEILRNKNLNLKAGTHRLVFTGLSPKINAQSILAYAKKGGKVLSVTSKINFLNAQKDSPKVKLIRDSVELINDKIQLLKNESNAYQEEKNMVLANRQISGQQGVTVAELTKIADFFRSRLLEVNKKLYEINKKQTNFQPELKRLNQQLRELNARKQPTSEVYVLLEKDGAGTIELNLRYIVNDAGWSPIYDLIAEDLDKDVILNYRAMTFNNTGIDWKDVKITLSTSDPLQSASKPVLNKWEIGYQVTSAIQYNQKLNKDIEVNYGNVYQNRTDIVQQSASDGIFYETIEISELSKDFNIEQPYSIPSDRKPYSIEINSNRLDASFMHYAVPKLDRDAFLLARITGWEELDLISGPVNIYNADTYVGQSLLDTRNLSDTLDLSLGRDHRVLIKRTKRKELNKKQFFGSSKKISLAYSISIKNNYSKPIRIQILDQIPVSSEKEVIVSYDEISKAKYTKDTGRLEWNLNISPGSTKKLELAYSVKFPRNKDYVLDQQMKGRQRKVMTPRFY